MERASGVIIRGNKILLLFREKNNKQYYILPGGGIEPGETPEQAMIREIAEECSSRCIIIKFLFSQTNEGRPAYYFLLDLENKEPELGGPEIKKQSESNHYEFVWLGYDEFLNLTNFNPTDVQQRLAPLIISNSRE
jgi:8-oxo-dGTP pyrophosphatase MutT (NUDIX family)